MKKTKLLFFITISTFAAIILFFSAIYPESQDEIRFSHDTFAAVFSQIKLTFTTDAPRFTVLLNVFLLRFPIAWKIIFTILNPLVQLFIILSLFFIITGKKVNLENKQNFYLFLLLILMYLYLIPCPSNTIFWLSGTLAYSWGFVPPLILLCLFRKTIDGKELKTSSLNNFLITLCGFAAGMSNENTGPMMLGLTVLFFIYCKYKKIKIPSLYYFALAGIILGLTAMFGSGAGTARLNASITNRAWQNLPITSKLFLFIWHFNRFLAATFWLPIINLLGLLLILYDKKKLALKDKDFILSSLFCICGFALSLVLFAAPYIDLRAHYSSAIFFFISFTIMLLLLWKFYNINFIKYLALILLIMGIIVSPLIAIPHISLYKQDKLRRSFVAKNRKNEVETIFVPKLVVLNGPTYNWTIEYYDILWLSFSQKLKKEFGGNISFISDPREYVFFSES